MVATSISNFSQTINHKKMHQSTLVSKLQDGPQILLEFRGETVQTVKYSKEGKQQEMEVHRVSFEMPTSAQAVTVEPVYAYGEPRKPLGYTKGQLILVGLLEYSSIKGVVKARGHTFIPYSESSTPPETSPAPAPKK